MQTQKMADDPINHPAYYTDGRIEVIDFIEDKNLGYHLGNAVKYISRAGKKSRDTEVQDLKKAVWYINRRIEKLEGINEDSRIKSASGECSEAGGLQSPEEAEAGR